MGDVDLVALLTVPIFTGAIGYVTNWSGVWMLFDPVRSAAVACRAWRRSCASCRAASSRSPGVMHGGDRLAGDHPVARGEDGQHRRRQGHRQARQPGGVLRQARPRADRRARPRPQRGPTCATSSSASWSASTRRCGATCRRRCASALHQRVQDQLPEIVRTLTTEIGDNIDQLLDIKLMVIRRMEASPALANPIFRAIGDQELRFIVNFGFFFGLAARRPDGDHHRGALPALVAAADPAA